MPYYTVSWMLGQTVEAENKYEAEKAARAIILKCAYTMDEVLDGDPLSVDELDEDDEEVELLKELTRTPPD